MFSSDNKKSKQDTMETSTQQNIIAQGTKIVGDIASQGAFRIDGTVEGNIKTSGKVVVGKTGFIKGTLQGENADFEGKVYLVEFFFSTCPTICPKMNRNLVDIQNTFPDRPDFGIASFTINPEYDTQEVLKTYAENYGITNPNWHFMTGNKDAIYNLANTGFNLYAAEVEGANGGFEHSGNFALIDKQGYIRSRTDAYGNPKIYYKGIISQAEQFNEEGESEDISALKEDILKLLENE